MIKVSKATLATIKRFPELYKRQAMQVIDTEVRSAISITADAFVMASMLVLIEEFGFGTKEDSTRLPRFVKALQDTIDLNATQYDDAVAEGLRNRLHNLGVDYAGGKKDEA
jgi:hypothetical protein